MEAQTRLSIQQRNMLRASITLIVTYVTMLRLSMESKIRPYMTMTRLELSSRLEILIIALIWLVAGLALGQTVVTTVQTTLATAVDPNTEWNFTGYSAVTSIIPIIPLVYYAGILVGFLVMIWASTKVSS